MQINQRSDQHYIAITILDIIHRPVFCFQLNSVDILYFSILLHTFYTEYLFFHPSM
jgi:hypothetical protein